MLNRFRDWKFLLMLIFVAASAIVPQLGFSPEVSTAIVGVLSSIAAALGIQQLAPGQKKS